mgnify:CR=1 FL=1
MPSSTSAKTRAMVVSVPGAGARPEAETAGVGLGKVAQPLRGAGGGLGQPLVQRRAFTYPLPLLALSALTEADRIGPALSVGRRTGNRPAIPRG